MLILTIAMNVHLAVRYKQLSSEMPNSKQSEIVFLTTQKMVWWETRKTERCVPTTREASVSLAREFAILSTTSMSTMPSGFVETTYLVFVLSVPNVKTII